jgi:hypothetical protein
VVRVFYSSCQFIIEFAPRYAEAIVLFKTGQDPVWHASVLEGMATVFVLDAWSAGQGLVSQLLLLVSDVEIVCSNPLLATTVSGNLGPTYTSNYLKQ